MRRLQSALLAAVAVIGFASLASAADMPVKGPVAAPVAYNWTGFYVGGNVGWVSQRDSGDSTFNDPGPGVFTTQSNSVTGSSAIGGLQAGYNWQINRWVLGIEGDWDWANPKTSFCRNTDRDGPACSDTDLGFLTLNSKTVWLATLRGRVGYTWDRFLVYGTGGVAWGKVDSSINANCLVAGCGFSSTVQNTTGSFSNTKAGWVAGAGIEAMLTANWTARVEYLHVDLGTISNTLNLPLSAPQSVNWSHKVTEDIVRVGANYKFGN